MNYTDKSKEIAEQKTSDVSLREALWRLECIISGTKVGIWEWNIQTGKITINKELAQMIGYSVNELSIVSLRTWMRTIHPNDQTKFSQLLESHFTGELPFFDHEYRLKHKEGHWVWVHARGLVSSHTVEGKPLMMFGTCTDSSERKWAEKRQLDTLNELKMSQKIANVGSWKLDLKTNTFTASEEGLQIFGFPPDSHPTFKEVSDCFLPEDRDNASKVLNKALKTGEKYSVEALIINKDTGKVKNILSIGEVRLDSKNHPVEIIGINQDITGRKKVEAEIEAKNLHLQELLAEKDKFFSIIAHDLQNPFNGFLGLTQMMAEELPSMTLDQIQKIAVTMQKSASNLFHLLQNLVEWSKIQQGIIPFDPEEIKLLPVVQECTAMVMESADNKKIKVVFDVPEDLAVFADRKMLYTIIRNFFANAVKFSPKGGIINLSAKANSNNFVEVCIKDSGIGMTKTIIENLFKLTVQTNRNGTEGEPSTGLGLIICKNFIEKHGGVLQIESEEGKGSTFCFILPTN